MPYRHLFLALSVTTVPENDTTCVIIFKRLVRALMEVLQIINIKIPLNNIIINGIVPIPDNIANEEVALIEPLACCLNAHLRFKSSH